MNRLVDYLSSLVIRKLAWIQSDAGAPSWECNDCTVIAWAHAKEVPYREAWLMMAALGRSPRCGFYGYGNNNIASRMSCAAPLKRILHKFKRGNWIIHIASNQKGASHVFAMKDGVVYDTFAPNPERRVYGYWKIKS